MQGCLFEIKLDFEEEEEIVGRFEDWMRKESECLPDDLFTPIPQDFKKLPLVLRVLGNLSKKQNFVEFESKKGIKDSIGKREEE